jgi:hypothetical protein
VVAATLSKKRWLRTRTSICRIGPFNYANFAGLVVHAVKKGQQRFVSEVLRAETFNLDTGRYDCPSKIFRSIFRWTDTDTIHAKRVMEKFLRSYGLAGSH